MTRYSPTVPAVKLSEYSPFFLSSTVQGPAFGPTTRASTRAPPRSSWLPCLSYATSIITQTLPVTVGSVGRLSFDFAAVGSAGRTKKTPGEPPSGMPSSSICIVYSPHRVLS